MENPNLHFKRPKSKYSSKEKESPELSNSESFSNVPSIVINSTPEYLTPKQGSTFSNKNEFTSSVQEFLKQSTEIQDEIRKLSEICQQISPKFTNSRKIEIPEKTDWEEINELIKSCNLLPLIIEDGQVTHNSLIDTFLETIYEYSAQLGISEQAKNEMKKLESILNDIQEKNQHLEQKIENLKSRKNIENEVRELERISKIMETKFKKMKASLKEKEEIIQELRYKVEKNDDMFENTNNLIGNDRSKEIFEIFMGREYKERSQSDNKVIRIIEMYEKYKYQIENENPGLNDLQVILDELEVPSANDALMIIARLKEEAFYSVDTERFIQEIYHELFLRPLVSKQSVKSEEVLFDILSKVSEIKISVISAGEFRHNLINAMECKKSINNEEIIEKAKIVSFIRKLFQIDEEENEFKIIHDIYFFVHEIKIFLQQARSIMGKDSISLSALLKEISQRLV